MTNLPNRTEALALLKKYRAGKCTPGEISRVERWYKDLDENVNLSSSDDAAINDATERILSLTTPANNNSGAKMRKIIVWASVAATLLIGAFTIALSLRHSPSSVKTSNDTFVTANGQRKEIHLPDGSVVDLNVASTLKLISFDKDNRLVSLTGEAFFHIAKDKAHPFIIRTGKIQTHVVGTSFDIFAYANEPVIKIAVATGKVQVEESNAPKNILGKNMTQNNLFSYSTINNKYSLTTVDVDKSTAWLLDRLNFDKATIGEIGRSLQRYFNIPVTITGQHVEDEHFTVKFEKTDLNKILDQLSALTGVECSLTNKGVVINTDSL